MRLFHKPSFVAIGFLLLYKPGFISGMPVFSGIDRLFDVLRILLIVYSLLSILRSCVRLNRLTGVVALFVLGMVWEMLVTFLNGANLASNIGAYISALGILLFTTVCLTKDERAFFAGSAVVLGGYVIINFVTVILFPGGMYASSMYKANYFLSYRTAWFPTILVALTVTLIWHERTRSRFSMAWSILLVVSAFASMVLVWTATGLMCFSLGALFLIFWWVRKNTRPLRISAVILFELAAFVAIVFLGAQKSFAFIIVDLLKKDITLSERLRIWNSATWSVQQHFWLGIGNYDVDTVRGILGWGASHAHNFYLNRLFFYGIAGLAISISTLFYAGKDLLRSGVDMRCKQILVAAVITMCTAFQVEAYASIWFYLCPLYSLIAFFSMKRKDRSK